MLEFISILALIFLSLFSYSAGTVSGSRKHAEMKPGIIDLLLIAVILTAAFVLGSLLDINRWLWVIVIASASGVIGLLRVLLRQPVKPRQSNEKSDSQSVKKNLWSRWMDFSTRVGAFQTRIILSIVYLVIISLVALPMRLFSDPLQIKIKVKTSYWLKRTEREALAEAVKQY